EASRQLGLLLGPLGRCWYLIDAGNAEDAVAELLSWPRLADGTALLGDAYLAVALLRAKEGAWGDAAAAFVEAHGFRVDVSSHADLIKQTTLRRVAELRTDAELEAAVDLLENVRPVLARDPAFDADLSATIIELARQLADSG